MINLYFIGSAGSGKSSLTGAYAGWMESKGYDAVTINLDPGIENAPYVPDVDIKEEILDDTRCLIRWQVTNGVFIRMAILYMLLAESK